MQTAEQFNAERTGRIEIIHKTDVDKAFEFLEMPPVPKEALEFIDRAYRASQGLTDGKDAGTNT